VTALLEWFSFHGRRYPFRDTNDPYRILVCEVLLRKTSSRQVAGIYHELFTRFPDVASLAMAEPQDVLRIIKPLGLHRRAHDLVTLAGEVMEKHSGTIPSSVEELMRLKGVGRYVASCVFTFGYGKWKPMVDSNIERVLRRTLSLPGGGTRGSPPEELWIAYESFAAGVGGRELHSALIDLSHIHCRPEPICKGCPIAPWCELASVLFKMDNLFRCR